MRVLCSTFGLIDYLIHNSFVPQVLSSESQFLGGARSLA
jgi:hypothetical protein